MYCFEKKDSVRLKENYLNMGQTSPSGENIYLNNLYLTKNGKPFCPVMGEAHISRLPAEEWKDRILKMKAAGINTVSSYLFWVNHEFEKGKMDFTGDNNISEFIRICKENDMYFCLRIGPWVNAEYRNGGFPDWIYTSGIKLRDNNEEYLYYVYRWYKAIYDNVKDYLFENNGNIIMIQFENELTAKPEHILKLREIAEEIGLTAPIYTATGWNLVGGALLPQREVLPMFGGYAAKPWTLSIDKIPISAHYNFSHIRNSAEIGNDLIKPGNFEVHIDLDNYPFAFCELGTGICVNKHRRPYISSLDDYSMVLTKLGSGCNLLGYYMFCGGINKMIGGTPLCRSNWTDYDALVYPIFNNYFQAPISEHGDYKNSYRTIKLLNLFVNDFGSELAQMQPFLQENPPKDSDQCSLRYAMRIKDESGYIFVNHHCHLLDLKPVYGVQFKVSEEMPAIPDNPIDITEDDAFFFPFGIRYNTLYAEYITAQPICKTEKTYFFKKIRGIEPVYKFKGERPFTATVGKDNGFIKEGIRFITLTDDEAEHFYKFADTAYIGNGCDLIRDNGEIKTAGFGAGEYFRFGGDGYVTEHTGNDVILAEVTAHEIIDPDIDKSYQYELFENFSFDNEKKPVHCSVERKIKYYELTVTNCNGYVHIGYSGDSAQLYYDGKMPDDNFYNGTEWVIPAKYLFNRKVILAIAEYTDDIYVDIKPVTSLSLDSVYVSA